jgi:ribonuclease HII
LSHREFEKPFFDQGFQIIAGVDEAGRGPLAGPVVAAACIIPPSLFLEGIADSKKLSPKQRKALYQRLTTHPEIEVAVGVVDHETIDRLNILQASLQAMVIAVNQLSTPPDFLLIDGNQLPPISLPSKAIVKGDALSQSIGAASIIAKHYRDQMMEAFHHEWPEYGFIKHKGYGTKTHREAIEKYGPCPIHRRSFEPIKSYYSLQSIKK